VRAGAVVGIPVMRCTSDTERATGLLRHIPATAGESDLRSLIAVRTTCGRRHDRLRDPRVDAYAYNAHTTDDFAQSPQATRCEADAL